MSMNSWRPSAQAGVLCLTLACVLATTWFTAPSAQAIQDDVYLPLDKPRRLFEGNPEPGEVRPLSAHMTHLDLAIYPVGMGYQRWHGIVGGDIVLFAFGKDIIWRAGLSAQTLADHRNEISFRLTRLYYEVRMGADFLLGPGILRARWVHRCSHGADDALPGRILIRSGPNLGYRLIQEWGRLRWDLDSHIHVTMAARNLDLSMHWRGNWTARSQLTWKLSKRFETFGAVGLAMMLISHGEEDIYLANEPIRRVRFEPLPSASVGLRYTGSKVNFGLSVNAQRTLDTGIFYEATTTDLLAIRFLFDW